MIAPSILFYPNMDKKSKNFFLIPIYLRIRNGKLKTEVKSDAYLTADELILKK